MCASTAAGLELQGSREYWSSNEEGKCATQIHKLSAEEKKYSN